MFYCFNKAGAVIMCGVFKFKCILWRYSSMEL
jgi:hypothetical protein